MAELKTKKNTASVEKFLNNVTDETRRMDSFRLVEIMKAETNAEPAMWGTSIVGFGSRPYKYASGRELDWPLIAFSPRKQDLTLYLIPGPARHSPLMKKLGKHKTGKSCLYIKKLADVHLPTLKALIKQSVADLAKR